MKKLVVFLVTSLLITGGFAQSQYEVSSDGSNKILKGIISKDILANDTSFKWYKTNQAGYNPNADAVKAIKEKSSQIRFVVFGGTWCDDTRQILPKFYSLLDVAAFTSDKVSLLGVDRSKKTLGYLAEAMGVINVPTIIVMKDGKEVGRVVEYGKTGLWDKELGEIVNSIK